MDSCIRSIYQRCVNNRALHVASISLYFGVPLCSAEIFESELLVFQNLAHWKAGHDCKDLSRARVSIHGHYFRSRLALKLSFGAFESWGCQLSHAPNESLRANLDLKLCPKVWKKIDKISRSRSSTHLIFLSRQFDTCRQIKLESLLKKNDSCIFLNLRLLTPVIGEEF